LLRDAHGGSVYPGLGHNVSNEELSDLATVLGQHLV